MIEGTVLEPLAARSKFGRESAPERSLVMGILNVTPDSFSDGGSYKNATEAATRALEMEREGAHIIDIGGESTRPGSDSVSEEEQIARIEPVILAIRKKSEIAISVDTTRESVARAALDAGADIINDISALRDDPMLGELAAERECPVILMHMLGTPKNMQENPTYGNVVDEVCEFLEERRDYAGFCGIDSENIILDPGFGFGKTVEHNLQLLGGFERLLELGRPVVCAVSRKSVIGAVLGREVTERTAGSLACAAAAVLKGAAIVRVHDVRETSDTVRMIEAVMRHGDEYAGLV